MAEEAAAVETVRQMGRFAAARGWTPATSGNFSARAGAARVAISRSGTDKGELAAEDVLVLPLDEAPPRAASAEAPLHWALYRADDRIGAIAHAHAPAASVLSRLVGGADMITLEGWELLKAIEGIDTHEARLEVPLVANTQDIAGLAEVLPIRREVPALVLAGHGLYAWGIDASAALRHLEALEAMFAMDLMQRGQKEERAS